jgi:tripartite-type tricarboxylate transporter receptor subunit TctC
MTTRRQILAAAAAGIALPLSFSRAAIAQSNEKVARMIVPFPVGGGTDAAARMVVEKIRTRYAGGAIVDNRPGASGRLAVDYVKASDPDGLTMLFAPDFVMTVYPHSFRKLSYNPLQDFVPVALCGTTAYAICAGPGLPASVTNVPQFIAWCKANPKLAAFASTSSGSATHFTGVMLSRSAGVDILHVAYKGGAPALQDLLGGQIPVSINPIGEVLPQLGGGRLRVLATTGAQRSQFLPNAPTLAESGFKEMVVEAWLGVLMPAKTPSDVVAKASAAINGALQSQDVKEGYAKFAMETVQSTPAAFGATIKSDLERWGPIVKASGFTAEE